MTSFCVIRTRSETSTSSQLEATIAWGPFLTYPEIFVSTNFLTQIHLASTRVRRIRSVYPEISVYALQRWNFCMRCVSGYVWTLVSVYFCMCWRHSIRTSLFPRELCWLILWHVRIRIGYVWTVVYDSYSQCVDADIFVSAKKDLRIQKSPDTCGRGLNENVSNYMFLFGATTWPQCRQSATLLLKTEKKDTQHNTKTMVILICGCIVSKIFLYCLFNRFNRCYIVLSHCRVPCNVSQGQAPANSKWRLT